MGNPYAPAKKNEPNVYDSEPSYNPTPAPEETTPTEEAQIPVSDSPEPPAPSEGTDDGAILEPPTGTISEVTQWVGDDKAKAEAALKAEKDGANRKTLVASLESIVSE